MLLAHGLALLASQALSILLSLEAAVEHLLVAVVEPVDLEPAQVLP